MTATTDRGPLHRPQFSLDLGPIEAGWIKATIESRRYWAQLEVSYLSDAIGDLLNGVVGLTKGEDAVRCSWFTEPGEYRWIFHRHGREVGCRILEFPDGERPEPDEAGTFVFETTLPLRVLVARVVNSVESPRLVPSPADYAREWGHPFPAAQLTLLHSYLATPEV